MIKKSSSNSSSTNIEKFGEIYTTEGFGREIDFFDPRGETMQHRFRTWCKSFSSKNALAFREKNKDGTWGEYRYITYKQFEERVNHFGSGLRHLGFKKGDHIGILSKNCVEWMIYDMACAVQGFVSVPIYDSYGKEIDGFLMTHSDCIAVVVQAENLPMVLSLAKEGAIPKIKTIIGIDNQTTFDKSFEGCDYRFSEVCKFGEEHPYEDADVKSDELLTIVYTSGTSGQPKGSMLSNENLCSGYVMMGARVAPTTDDGRVISYLPLAHVFDRTIEYSFLEKGGCVGYFHGEMAQLVSDLKVFRPTALPGVPRSLTKMYEAVINNINKLPWFKRTMFWAAYNWKRKLPFERRIQQNTWADAIFKNVRDVVGGQVRIIVSGAAALNPTIAEFLHVVLAVPFGEGYGQTETSCCITGPHLSETHFGAVGIPFQYMEVRLMSLPEMGYLTTDKPYPRGEIQCRGPNVFMGYYKDKEATDKQFMPDGFYRSGDVGEWIPGPFTTLGPLKKGKDGKVKEGETEREPGLPLKSMRIIDRTNNVCKMTHGEYVVVEQLESMIEQSWYGDDKSYTIKRYLNEWTIAPPIGMEFIVAFVCPKWNALLDESNVAETGASSWPGVKEWWTSTPIESRKNVPQNLKDSLSKLPCVSDFFINQFTMVSARLVHLGRMKRYEMITGVVLCPIEWSPENGLTTASLKTRRTVVKKYFIKEFDNEVARVQERRRRKLQQSNDALHKKDDDAPSASSSSSPNSPSIAPSSSPAPASSPFEVDDLPLPVSAKRKRMIVLFLVVLILVFMSFRSFIRKN
ncbi:putative long chain acylcoA synthetase [Monocercomonoides exilis]|uniref:putative long chain acylcoA synthetase n=1 Tax=Monocercomonoides exilis TaxID=2049356 RepID=UPI003559784E|nr:putative long chain acylcoA synthetase [Monocercomonoides exilis]|eukprot:MONOS_6646.1-p1 / transcript=MONOS_6646.1 / gene=MONOS_6646 / organism=Monocercomonoides_exilis_PA203 / gene_product=long chain acylcoA synthetase / transcript_product=long chain acylcoA synthetase / location=Mono_scaffold00213:12852-15248(+) / protein_length=799 / sequence_SO=supercontig / SO=protein_coding / is_pseudo=false